MAPDKNHMCHNMFYLKLGQMVAEAKEKRWLMKSVEMVQFEALPIMNS